MGRPRKEREETDSVEEEVETEEEEQMGESTPFLGLGGLMPPSLDEMARRERDNFRDEARKAIEVVMDMTAKQRPDVQFGKFYDALDPQTKVMLFFEWMVPNAELVAKARELGAFTIEELLKTYRTKTGVEQVLSANPINAKIRESVESLVEERLKPLAGGRPIAPRMDAGGPPRA